MNSFMNLAKQGLEAYGNGSGGGSDNSDVRKTGGQEYNSPHHSGQSGQQRYSAPPIDHEEAIKGAQQHHDGSGHADLFSSALSFISDNKDAHHEPVDEDQVVEAHKAAYDQEGGGGGGLNAKSLGSAAAMQVFKKFTSGGGSSSGSGGGGNTQTQLISMAMAEATKLFDKFGGGSSGSKQDAVNGAAMTVMKLFVQSKFGGTTGGSNSGGLGSLMGLASKFV